MTSFLKVLLSLGMLFFVTAALGQEEAAPVAQPEETSIEADGLETSVRTAKNSVWLEGLGSALGYSINYERMVIDDLGVRLGFSYMSFGASVTDASGTTSAKSKFFIFPITASYLGIASESKKHCLELGAGATLIFASGSGSGMGMSSESSGMAGFGNFFAGYRIQPAQGGFQFRAGLMGLFGPGLSFSVTDPTKWGLLPWGYISLGGSF